MRRSCLAFLFVLWSATASLGGVIGSVTTVTTFSSPDAALTGHTGYVVSLQTDDGSLISAVDVNITGPLHQRWNYSEDELGFVATPISLNITNGDSHLLVPANGLVGANPTENNNVSQSPLADTAARDYGYGSFLKGAWGIPAVNQTNRLNVAYFVVPNDSLPQISIAGLAATSNGTFPFSHLVYTPLPGILTSNPVPGPGIECQFGCPGVNGPSSIPIALSNTGGGVINVSSITLAGPNAANFILTGTLPTQLVARAAPSTFNVAPNLLGQPFFGIYSAHVLVNTSAGNLVFDVGTSLCPEPSALLIAGLAVVGLALRWRK